MPSSAEVSRVVRLVRLVLEVSEAEDGPVRGRSEVSDGRIGMTGGTSCEAALKGLKGLFPAAVSSRGIIGMPAGQRARIASSKFERASHRLVRLVDQSKGNNGGSTDCDLLDEQAVVSLAVRLLLIYGGLKLLLMISYISACVGSSMLSAY